MDRRYHRVRLSGIPTKPGMRLVHAAGLGELYKKAGWYAGDGTTGDHRLAEFIFRNLRGSGYAAGGYGSVEDVLKGDVGMINHLARTPDGDVHLYAAVEPTGMRAFMLWYSLRAGGPGLLPPDNRKQGALPRVTSLRDVAYGDWLIVDASSRVRGLGGALFALMLHDMARSRYRHWYGRTIVPDNLELYERLYVRKGRARLVGEWQDGPLTRISFMGDLEEGWTEELLRSSLEGKPALSSLF